MNKNITIQYFSFFLWLCMLNCSNKKNNIIFYPLKLNVDSVTTGDYVISADGFQVFIIKNNTLVKYHIINKTYDSIPLPINTFSYKNLISINNQLGILYFDKKKQYETLKNKHVYMLNINNDLSIIGIDSFLVNIGLHLLDEDFKFVDGYYSKNNKEYIFNDYFGNSLIVKNHIWDNKFHNQIIVDPITGDIHKIDKLCLRYIGAKTSNQCIFPKNKIGSIKQASVFNNKLVFYCDSYIYYSQMTSDRLICSKNVEQFNVCKRFENGIYKLQGNNVMIYKLTY